MAWMNPPYIVPTSDLYGNSVIFDYSTINPSLPTECCQQPQLQFTFSDYNQPFPQTLTNFPLPDFSQYIAAEQPLLDNENDNDDESDSSSDYSVPSPGEIPADSYFAHMRSEGDQGESINSRLQRQNFLVKQEEDAFCQPTVNELEHSTSYATPQNAFGNHPLYNTYVSLSELWGSMQEGLINIDPAEIEAFLKDACHNLSTLGGSNYPGDSVIRYQIGWLVDQMAEVVAVKSEYHYSEGVPIEGSDPTFGEFTGASIDSSIYPVCGDIDGESSSDDTIKEEFLPTISKAPIKRKHDEEDDDDEEETEEDGDEDDFSAKRQLPKDAQKKRRENYAPDISFELFSWWFDNDGAAPNAQAKQELAQKTGKNISQIATWYQNAKRRYSNRLEEFRVLKAQHPHEVRDYRTYDAFMRSQGSGSSSKRRRMQ